MRLNRNHAGWAVKLWVLVTVFTLPFMEPLHVVGWLVVGAIAGIVWKLLPEGPPLEKEKLPFHDQYADKQVPRRDE